MLNKYWCEWIQRAYRRRKLSSVIAKAFLDPIHYLTMFERN